MGEKEGRGGSIPYLNVVCMEPASTCPRPDSTTSNLKLAHKQ